MPGVWHNIRVAIIASAMAKSVHCNNAMEVAKKMSKEAAARQFDVDPQRIREWCAQK